MNAMKKLSIAMPNIPGSSTVGQSDTESTFTESTMSKAVTDSTFGKPRQSLASVMFARKFSKRLSNKATERKCLGTIGSSSAGHIPSKEPTYRMEPLKRFSCMEAERITKEVVEDNLNGFKYNPRNCTSVIKSISDEIKDKIKSLGYDRYKIICVISLCQKSGQSAVCCSRAMLDKEHDTYATYTMKTEDFVCNATVFGMYRE
ncbi:hypothetical protein ACF0H5_004254 [Mactra antiquata]